MISKHKVFRRMTGITLLLLFVQFVCFSTVVYAAGESVVIPIASERTLTVTANQSAFIAPNIELNDFGFNISSAKVVIENLPSDASTSYTGVSGLAVSYDGTKKVYTITGEANASVYQTLFRSFKINCGTTLQNDITYSFVVSANTTTPMYYSGTGHYYEYISNPTVSWTSAFAAASARTYNNMEGYLVTITSAGENAFVVAKTAESGWIGASDSEVNNKWVWETGPESGTQFWQGLDASNGGYAVGGSYTNWLSGEPNDDGGLGDYAYIFVNSPGWDWASTKWNDMPNSNSFVQGYIVEYGGMAGDAPEDFDETVTVNIAGSVTYHANGATSGTVPVDSNSPYASGDNVTVLTNSGALAKTGYTFNGWNTQANGGGTHYDASGTNSFSISSSVTLYAEWGCSITYNSNGATSGAVPVDSSSPYTSGTNVTVLTNSGTLAKTGYTFDGWNSQANGGGTHYDASGTDSFTISSNTTLYAQWGCDIIYDANGATSGAVPVDSSSPYASGSSVTVLTNSGTLARTGYIFDGWNMQADGGGTHYDASGTDSFVISSNTTLYAEWLCSVTYDANGATSGTMPTDSSSPYSSGESVTVLTNSGRLVRTGYIFDGWNTQEDGHGTHYDASGTDAFTISSNTTLYSEWEEDSDGDGISDADETSAGTDPNDPDDIPRKGKLVITIYEQDGSPAAGLICVLNSTPVMVTTNSNGVAEFSNVNLVPHTLALRNGTSQLGTYSLNFTAGASNSTTVTDDASTDSDGSVKPQRQVLSFGLI